MIEMLSALARGTPSVTAVESMVNAHEIAVSNWKSMCSSSMWENMNMLPFRKSLKKSVHVRLTTFPYIHALSSVSPRCSRSRTIRVWLLCPMRVPRWLIEAICTLHWPCDVVSHEYVEAVFRCSWHLPRMSLIQRCLKMLTV